MKLEQLQEATYHLQEVYVVISYPGTKAWGPFTSHEQAENYVDNVLIENGRYNEWDKEANEAGLAQLNIVKLEK
jgi:hypothetical protein